MGVTVVRLRNWTAGLFSICCTLAGLALVTFLIGRAIPIDPAIAILGDKASAEAVARLRVELALDQPLFQQFAIYVGQLSRGDLGQSVMTGNSVVTDIARFLPATVELATTAMLVALLAGIPLGVLSAAWQGSRFDNSVRVLSLAGQSTPVFVLALICLVVFYAKLGIVPGTGRQSMAYLGVVPDRTGMLLVDAALARQWGALKDAAAHLALPSLLLAYYSMSIIVRMVRTFMLDAFGGEYVLTAKAKGLSNTWIIWRHVFPNIAGRLMTVLALTYASLLEGAVLTETVFSWPGLGLYLTRSLLNADLNAVLGATLVIGIIYVGLNLAADIAQRFLDPRVA